MRGGGNECRLTQAGWGRQTGRKVVTHAKSEEKENKMGDGDTGAERERGAKRNRYGVRWRRTFTPKERKMGRPIRGKRKIQEESEETDQTRRSWAYRHTRKGKGRPGQSWKGEDAHRKVEVGGSPSRVHPSAPPYAQQIQTPRLPGLHLPRPGRGGSSSGGVGSGGNRGGSWMVPGLRVCVSGAGAGAGAAVGYA